MPLTKPLRTADEESRTEEGPTLRPLSLERNFGWTLLGTAVYMLCQWGMLVVLARLGSPEKVGAFALGLAISTPVLMFTNLGLRRLQATDAAGEFRFADYFALRLRTIVVALGAIAVLVAVNGYRGEKAWVVLAIGVAKGVEALSDTTYGLLQRHERMDRIGRSLVLRGALSLGVFSASLGVTGNVLWASLALAVSWSAVLFIHDLPAIRPLLRKAGETARPAWEPGAQRRLVALALPIGFVMMLGALEASIPSWVIESRLGARSLGLYTALAYFLAASNRVTNALGESGMPRLATTFAKGDAPGFRQLLARLLGVAAIVGVLGIAAASFFGRPLLQAFYGADYAREAQVLTWLMIVALIQNVQTILQYAMTAARYVRIQPVVFSIAALLNAGLCFWLIPTRGLAGAALATGAVFALEILMSLGVVAVALGRSRRPPQAALAGET